MNALSRYLPTSRTIGGIGLLLLLADVVLATRPPFQGNLSIVEGKAFSRSDPDTAFTVREIRPIYDAAGELAGLHATFELPDGEILELPGGARLSIGDCELAATSIGVALTLSVHDDATGQAVTSDLRLNIWQPGLPTQEFEVDGLDGRAQARLFPELELTPSGPNTKSMALRDPAVELTLVPKTPGGPAGRKLLRPGDELKFRGGAVRLDALSHWVTLEVTAARGRFWLWVGLALLALGASMYVHERERRPTQRNDADRVEPGS